MSKKQLGGTVPVSLDATFYRELFRFYKENRGTIRSHYRQLTRVILDYNDPANKRPGQFLRQPQFEAFEMYVFLKEYLHSRPVHEIFTNWYRKQNGFEKRGDVLGMGGKLALSDEFSFNETAYKAMFKKMEAAKQAYANYIFALTMGVGKTLLMATCIFYEFTLARKWSDDPKYCHNALIFAPDKTVLQSLREIESFDFSRVLPPEHANWLAANLRMQYLDEAGAALNTLDESSFNLIISNAQKIILKKKNAVPTAAQQIFLHTPEDGAHSVYDDYADLYGFDTPEDEQDLNINQRFLKLRKLPQLGIYVDEAHHAFGSKLAESVHDSKKETSLRFTINMLTKGLQKKGTNMVGCYNFTGTPYVNNEVLPEVIYAYGLESAISNGYLKSIRLHGYTNPRGIDFVRAVVTDFLVKYGQRRVENKLPKLAFFAADIDDADKNLRPLLEKVVAENNIPTSSILINVGDEKITRNEDIKLFNELDSEHSTKQFLILVNKGKEGWNCRSLCGVAMFRRPRSKVFVLQASMRCLRSIGEKQEEGQVYLSQENIQVLEDELQQNFRLTTDELQKVKQDKTLYEVRVLKKKSIKLTRIRQMYERKPKELKDQVSFGLDDWDVEQYRLRHTEQNALLQRGKKSSVTVLEEDLTHLKTRRAWTDYTLIAEISRYLNESPLKIEPLLTNCKDGLDALLAKINEFNELLYDKVIPALFHELYDISSYEKKEEQEVDLVREPEGGFYSIHGDPDKTELFSQWANRPDQANKSFHLDTYCFDSFPERDFFLNVIGQEKAKEIYFMGMLTHGQSDFRINYIDPDTHTVRSYYPDFLIRTVDNEWLVVEVKALYQMQDAVVQAKYDFAEKMLSASNIKYRMVPHTGAASYAIGSNTTDSTQLSLASTARPC